MLQRCADKETHSVIWGDMFIIRFPALLCLYNVFCWTHPAGCAPGFQRPLLYLTHDFTFSIRQYFLKTGVYIRYDLRKHKRWDVNPFINFRGRYLSLILGAMTNQSAQDRLSRRVNNTTQYHITSHYVIYNIIILSHILLNCIFSNCAVLCSLHHIELLFWFALCLL